ncbi:hypothetical protein R5R35_011259 [Gryllus longicercus]|uniref:Odorant binding protein n=1 Tax=Gryllus longicercus TaxID=2509291 RepID=A0AAN9VZ63_9ORTH
MSKLSMKSAVAIGVVASFLLIILPSDAKKAEYEKKIWHTDACNKAFLERQKLEESWTEEERKNSTAGKCFITCIMEKRGLVRRGSVDEKRVLEYVRATAKSINTDFKRTRVDARRWEQLTLKCTRHMSSMNSCELGYNVWNCLLTNMRESTYRLAAADLF